MSEEDIYESECINSIGISLKQLLEYFRTLSQQ